MRLSIVIPAYNEAQYLRDCLESVYAGIRQTAYKRQVEVIVVDNAPTDDTAEVARSVARVRVVHEARKGLTRARQAGLLAARGDIVGYLDADVRMMPDWIDRILVELDRDPGIVCISGPCTYYGVSKLRAVLVWLYWNLLAMPVYWITRYMVLGGNFAARKEALQKIGGFDGDIAFYGEDTNIARRLHTVGKVKFTRRIQVAASARRFNVEGIWITTFIYVMNFLSEVILKRPVTRTYQDIR